MEAMLLSEVVDTTGIPRLEVDVDRLCFDSIDTIVDEV